MSKLTIQWDEEKYEDFVSSSAPKSIREVKLAAINFLDATEAKLNLLNDKYVADRAALAKEDEREKEVKDRDKFLEKETSDLQKKAEEAETARVKARAEEAERVKAADIAAEKRARTDRPITSAETGTLPATHPMAPGDVSGLRTDTSFPPGIVAPADAAGARVAADRAAGRVSDPALLREADRAAAGRTSDPAVLKEADRAAADTKHVFDDTKTGQLPDDFPGREQLRAADINTYAQARKAGLAEGGFQSLPGIGPSTATKIEEALK